MPCPTCGSDQYDKMSNVAWSIVSTIEADLSDRGGFDSVLSNVSEDTKNEIMDTMHGIVMEGMIKYVLDKL